jgi:hypothetical protein
VGSLSISCEDTRALPRMPLPLPTHLKLDSVWDVEQAPDLALELLHALGPWLDCDAVHNVAQSDHHDGLCGALSRGSGGRQASLPVGQLRGAEATEALLTAKREEGGSMHAD